METWLLNDHFCSFIRTAFCTHLNTWFIHGIDTLDWHIAQVKWRNKSNVIFLQLLKWRHKSHCGFASASLTPAEAEMTKEIVTAWREALDLLHWVIHKVSYNWKKHCHWNDQQWKCVLMSSSFIVFHSISIVVLDVMRACLDCLAHFHQFSPPFCKVREPNFVINIDIIEELKINTLLDESIRPTKMLQQRPTHLQRADLTAGRADLLHPHHRRGKHLHHGGSVC